MDFYYFSTSYWSRIIALVLAEKKLEPTRHFVDIRVNGNYAPAYLKINPKGVVPTIVDEGIAFCNAPRIAAHLDTVAGPPLCDGLNDAEVDRWIDQLTPVPVMLMSYSVWVKGLKGERSADILQDKVVRAERYAEENPDLRELYERKRAFFEDFRAQVHDPEHVAAEARKLTALLDDMGRVAAQRPWLAGERYSLADCIATSMLYRFVDLGKLVHWHGDTDHGLDDYYRRLCQRPNFKAVFEDDPLIP